MNIDEQAAADAIMLARHSDAFNREACVKILRDNLSGGNSEQPRNTVKSGECAPPAQGQRCPTCNEDLTGWISHAALTVCRDHWKISFEHERQNVIRLREIVYKFHSDNCVCEDCNLVRKKKAFPGEEYKKVK